MDSKFPYPTQPDRPGTGRWLDVNAGTGPGHAIRQLAEAVAKVVDYRGRLVFDVSKPDGTPRKPKDGGKMGKPPLG